MKKGNTIRLLIKEKNQNGIVFYYNKKKEDVFLPIDEIRKADYKNAIPGGYLDVRVVSSRPKLLVSGKFVHPNETIIEDYKPLSQSEPQQGKQIPTDKTVEKKREIMGIQNKIITITKANQFNKGWTLFQPYNPSVYCNRSFRDTLLSDIVRLITHSIKVNIILCETCLSSRIINEIEWVNQYIELNIIAKYESIIKSYSGFKFSSVTIDNSIDFNYIGVIGNESGYYMISDGYVKIDESVDKVYFQKQSVKKDYSFLKSVDSVIIVDKDGEEDYSEFIKETKKVGVECYYAVNTAYYNRKHFDFAQKESLKLLVSNKTYSGVILVNKEGTLSCVLVGARGFFITYPIAKITVLLGEVFKCCFYKDIVDTKSLKEDIYSCYNCKLQKLNIAPQKTIEIDVPIKDMADFVSENYDSSITENHNDYSAEAIKVEYIFTLIPPLFNTTYTESDIYKPIHELAKQWKSLQTLDIDKIKANYNSIIDEDFGLIIFFEESISFTDTLIKAVNKCSYVGYYTWLKATSDLYRYYDENLIEVFKVVFNAINRESSGTKFNKFDDEIAGYEQTIEEKTRLINQGVDVLSNKRRVEILSKKIEDLLALKKKFEGNTTSRNDKNLSSFIDHCNELLLSNSKTENDDSIGTIVKPKEETKIARLYAFVDKYLYSIKKYIEKCLLILNKLQVVHIPENYPVFDKNGERFIVIDELKEFEQTKSLCDEFKIKCITWR